MSGIFGLDYTIENSGVIIIPAEFDATTSYKKGTAKAFDYILEASKQVDLFDLNYGNIYERGICVDNRDRIEIQDLNKKASRSVNWSRYGHSIYRDDVNKYCNELNELVYNRTKEYLDSNKKTVVIGGDHAVSFGAIKAYAEKYNNLSILHIDAHMDLRMAYEGFTWSHASIMYNVIEKTHIQRLIQAGIRDFSLEESIYAFKQGRDKYGMNMINTIYQSNISRDLFNGITFNNITKDILADLTDNVYVSLDIDGLDPVYCPNTGTPVPGGLTFDQVVYILSKVRNSGHVNERKIVGFDIVETGAGEYDGNVTSRLLYKLCGMIN